jgi:rhodanese-related sulfurtransferase
MPDIAEILKLAQARARKMGLPYEGALLPAEAQAVLAQQPGAKLVDVRSRAELDFVGRVPGSVEIEWKSYPGMLPNPKFLEQLKAQVPQDATVMFLCRSGGRSHETAAVAAQAGYLDAYNILEGFEGDRDAGGHRNTVGGWRAHGLPWVQS